MLIKRKSSKLFVKWGHLFGRVLNQAPLRCIAVDEVTRFLTEVHVRDLEITKGALGFINRSLIWVIIDPSWKLTPPSLCVDAKHARSMQTEAKLQENLTPHTNDHWPFHTWAIELKGPDNPSSRGHIQTLPAIECQHQVAGGSSPQASYRGCCTSSMMMSSIHSTLLSGTSPIMILHASKPTSGNW